MTKSRTEGYVEQFQALFKALKDQSYLSVNVTSTETETPKSESSQDTTRYSIYSPEFLRET
jgi:hypothetical protein